MSSVEAIYREFLSLTGSPEAAATLVLADATLQQQAEAPAQRSKPRRKKWAAQDRNIRPFPGAKLTAPKLALQFPGHRARNAPPNL
jgi:hypothetical protein